MAWIEGTEEQTFTVEASYQDTLEYFGKPENFKQCLNQLESAEELDDGVWHWVLEEKSEKGITYKADYKVRYVFNEDEGEVTWEPHGEDNNMKSSGFARIKEASDGTQVHYKETIASDLPIPKLMAKVFKPIVAREIAKGVGEYLECSKNYLNSL